MTRVRRGLPARVRPFGITSGRSRFDQERTRLSRLGHVQPVAGPGACREEQAALTNEIRVVQEVIHVDLGHGAREG